MKPHSWEPVNLVGSCVPMKGVDKEMSMFFKCGLKMKERHDPRIA